MKEAVEEALPMASLRLAKFLKQDQIGSVGLCLDTEPIWSC
ncbi:hypothetical protein GGE65_000213 [Skermanella aerolata]|nr:hypothetical protein [Skermanella aerolata]KJB94053.1 hypothetical protein N826_20060 [Skermanella aerolata KACC 11604]